MKKLLPTTVWILTILLWAGGPPVQCNSTTPVANALFTCNNGVHILLEKVCNQNRDCPDGEDEENCGDCVFNNDGLCGYIVGQKEFGNFTWKWYSVAKLKDHLPFGQDYLIASGHSGVATLSSRIIRQISNGYFVISYLSNQLDQNHPFESDLRVLIELANPNNRSLIPIWQSSLEKSLFVDKFQSIRVKLHSIRQNFRLHVEARTSEHTPDKYHALRYFSLESYNYHPQDSHVDVCPTPVLMYFHCANQRCIEAHKKCDFVDDCGDASDETFCEERKMVNFENGAHYWRIQRDSAWRIAPADEFYSLTEGPTYDHSTGFNGGHFIYANASGGGVLVSPAFKLPAALDCNLRLSVFSTEHALIVVAIGPRSSEHQYQFALNPHTSPDMFLTSTHFSWVSYSVHLDVSFPPGAYELLISPKIEPNLENTPRLVEPYIAIDDITFSSGCQMA